MVGTDQVALWSSLSTGSRRSGASSDSSSRSLLTVHLRNKSWEFYTLRGLIILIVLISSQYCCWYQPLSHTVINQAPLGLVYSSLKPATGFSLGLKNRPPSVSVRSVTSQMLSRDTLSCFLKFFSLHVQYWISLSLCLLWDWCHSGLHNALHLAEVCSQWRQTQIEPIF